MFFFVFVTSGEESLSGDVVQLGEAFFCQGLPKAIRWVDVAQQFAPIMVSLLFVIFLPFPHNTPLLGRASRGVRYQPSDMEHGDSRSPRCITFVIRTPTNLNRLGFVKNSTHCLTNLSNNNNNNNDRDGAWALVAFESFSYEDADNVNRQGIVGANVAVTQRCCRPCFGLSCFVFFVLVYQDPSGPNPPPSSPGTRAGGGDTPIHRSSSFPVSITLAPGGASSFPTISSSQPTSTVSTAGVMKPSHSIGSVGSLSEGTKGGSRAGAVSPNSDGVVLGNGLADGRDSSGAENAATGDGAGASGKRGSGKNNGAAWAKDAATTKSSCKPSKRLHVGSRSSAQASKVLAAAQGLRITVPEDSASSNATNNGVRSKGRAAQASPTAGPVTRRTTADVGSLDYDNSMVDQAAMVAAAAAAGGEGSGANADRRLSSTSTGASLPEIIAPKFWVVQEDAGGGEGESSGEDTSDEAFEHRHTVRVLFMFISLFSDLVVTFCHVLCRYLVSRLVCAALSVCACVFASLHGLQLASRHPSASCVSSPATSYRF